MIDEKKPLLEHLGELRKRIILCAIAIAAGMIISYIFYDIVILDIIRAPIDMLSGKQGNPFAVWNPLQRVLDAFREKMENPEFELHYINPLEGLTVKLKLSFYCGLFIALPIVILQLWKLTKTDQNGYS